MIQKGRLVTAAMAAGLLTAPALAAQIRVACYSDGNECAVTDLLAKRFAQANPDVTVVVDTVPYKALMESLPVQLAAGQGPDIARVTDFGAISHYLLDMRSLLPDATEWETNYGKVLAWMRTGPDDHGIYGLPTQLTVTGLIVNASLFEQADVPMPGDKATWEDWEAATEKVAKATHTDFAMAMDRSGHRFAAGAISFGAKYFAPDGTPRVTDDGFKAFAQRFVAENGNGVYDRDVWAGTGGGGYRDAFEDFANGRIVAYDSGSWQVSRLQQSIGDGFDWRIAAPPCGPVACTPMPGGAILVAFKQTKAPKDVARFLDYLASAPVYSEMMAKTVNLPAHAGLQKAGITYDVPAPAAAALKAFTEAATQISPVAYQLQGYVLKGPVLNATASRLSQAIVGELTLDQAYARIEADVATALAGSK